MSNMHTVPGMGYASTAKASEPQKREVVCRVKCGEVQLKLTLTQKFLGRTLREVLVEPFLKVHNKRAPAPVRWEDVLCIALDGYPVDPQRLEDTANSLLVRDNDHFYPFTAVELATSLPSSLVDALLHALRAAGLAKAELFRIAEAAADVDASPPDAYTERGCSKAFDVIGAGEGGLLSSAEVRAAFLTEEAVRSVCIPAASKHGTLLDDAFTRMFTSSEATVELAQFTRFFAAVCAVALAPAAAAVVLDEPGMPTKQSTGSDLLDSILDDDRVTSRRIA